MKKKQVRSKIVFWLFLAPALLAFLAVQIVPFFLGLYYSFTNWTASAQLSIDFVGLTNYLKVFKDTSFIYSTIITSIFTLISVILVNIVAFSLAILVTSKVRGKNFYRAGFFLPNVIGGIILGYIWQFIFNNLVPSIAGFLNITYLQNNFMLANPKTALLAIIIVNTWQYAGYIMMIYVAALQNVPQDLIDASLIDGCNKWQKFKNITVPMIMPAFTVTLFLTLVNSFKQYDVNASLTGPGPSTLFMGKVINGTELLAQNIANTSLVGRDTALAQAKSIIFFVVLVGFSLLQVYFTKKREVDM